MLKIKVNIYYKYEVNNFSLTDICSFNVAFCVDISGSVGGQTQNQQIFVRECYLRIYEQVNKQPILKNGNEIFVPASLTAFNTRNTIIYDWFTYTTKQEIIDNSIIPQAGLV